MRRLTNIVFALGAIAFIGVIVSLQLQDRARHRQIEHVAEEVRRFELVIKYQAATNEVELTGRGWPKTINPAWFTEQPPTNTLLTADRPWVEIATPEQAELMHPPDRIASDATVAMFWYNPYQGVIRTRVPPTISDQRALDLYNRLNRCNLNTIFPIDPDGEAATDLLRAGEADGEQGDPDDADADADAPDAGASDPGASPSSTG